MTEGQHQHLRTRRLATRIVRVVGVIAVLTAIIAATAAWMLSPSRLAERISRIAERHLNASVSIGKIEVSFVKTFPTVSVSIDSVVIESHTLPPDVKEKLTASADTLLTLGRLTGSLNAFKAIRGEIDIDSVELLRPYINMVSVNDSVNNYTVVDLDGGNISGLPNIALRNLSITDARPLIYTDLSDGSRITVHLDDSKAVDTPGGDYELSTCGEIIATTGGGTEIKNVAAAIRGKVAWRGESPREITISRLALRAGTVDLTGDIKLSLTTPVTISAMDMEFEAMPVKGLFSQIPVMSHYDMSKLDTDLTAAAKFKLVKPHAITARHLPSVDFDVTIPRGRLSHDNGRITIESFECHATGRFDGETPDRSVINLDNLRMKGRGVTAAVTATITTPISDPTFSGRFDGTIDFDVIPKFISEVLPMRLGGQMEGHTKFGFSMADLTLSRLHHVKLNGDLRLSRFFTVIPGDSLTLKLHSASVSLTTPPGTNHADSLLKAVVSIDSGRIDLRGMTIDAANLRCDVATLDSKTSPDRSIINPTVVTLTADSLSLNATRSALRLRHLTCGTNLRRYHDKRELPLLDFRLAVDSLDYRTEAVNASLATCDISVNARISRLGAADTTGYALPIGEELVDFGLSRTLRYLIATWGAKGSLKARSGRIFTPAFPTVADIRKIDVDFTPDNVNINGIDGRAGHSDLHLSGSIANVRRALTAADGTPLKISLDITSDTIDLNQMARIAFKARPSEPADTSEAGIHAVAPHPLLLPLNLDLSIGAAARTILYYDVMLYDLATDMTLTKGRLDINRLSALTDMGNVDLKAFYDAPRPEAMSFGADARLQQVDIKEMLRLIPYVDSILPMMKNFSGTIDARIAGTTLIDSAMCMDNRSIKCSIDIAGHDLSVEGIKQIERFEHLLPKRDRPLTVRKLTVDIDIADGEMDVYPYMIDIDGWRIAASENEGAGGDIDVRLAFLHSAVPWKWGFEFTRRDHHNHFRFSGPKLRPGQVARRYSLAPYRLSMLHYINTVTSEGTRVAREGHIVPGQTNPRLRNAPKQGNNR